MKKGKIYLWQFLANNLVGFLLVPIRLRALAYMFLGIKTNSKNFEPNIWFYSNKISIGEGTYINRNCCFYNEANIEIGKNCFFGPEVLVLTISHNTGRDIQRAGSFYSSPIIIKDGVWIGARTTILPGVTIKQGCIVAARSVVTKNCEPNGLYAGIPARRIKELAINTL